MTASARHPDPADLEALALGRTPDAERPSLELHLDSCPSCAEVVAEMARLYGSGVVARSGATRLIAPELAATEPALGSAWVPTGMLGRYRLGRRIGEGGMGVVVEAHDPELDRRIAVKLLRPDARAGAEAVRARLLREARAMARLQHPNVVAVYDVGRVGEQVFIAMELVEGTTLRRWLRAESRSRAEVLRVFAEAGRGLAAAHAVGLVHRDFKPDNVLVGADGRARVTDFGLARPLAAGDVGGIAAAAGPDAPGHTAAGVLAGTPAYMAPEQLQGDAADARSDQFAFCVALFEALFGERPYSGASLRELTENVLAGRARAAPLGTPRWLRSLLARGIATDAVERHASMAALLDELERDRGRVRRMAMAGAGMAVAVAAVVLVLRVVTGVTTPAPPPRTDLGAPPPCGDAALELDQRWNATRRSELGLQLKKVVPLRGADIFLRTSKELDPWADAWRGVRARACERAGTDALAARRDACLDGRLRAFDALVAVAGREAITAEQLLAAAEALPSPLVCDVDLRLGPEPPPPSDRDAVLVVQNDLANAEALLAVGQADEAASLAERALAEAKRIGYAPALAHAKLVVALVEVKQTDAAGAADAFESALVAAQGAGDDELTVRAALGTIDAAAARIRPADAERGIGIVQRAVERTGDRLVEADLSLRIGALRRAEGRHADALAAIDKAVSLRRQALGGDAHAAVALALVERSAARLALGDAEGAQTTAQEARTILDRVAGRDDLRGAAALLADGRALAALGRHQEALERFERARHLRVLGLPSGHEPNTAAALIAVGDASLALGRADQARAAYDGAASHVAKAPELAVVLGRQGDLASAAGAHADAVALHQKAVAHLEAAIGADDDARLVTALRGLARAQAAAGDRAAARRTLERALAIVERELGFVVALVADIELDLAAVEHAAGDRKAELHHLDEANLPLDNVCGHDHPRAQANTLARADLAWSLGDHEYGGRLYSAVAHALAARLGPDHADARRAAERATADKPAPPEQRASPAVELPRPPPGW